MVCRRPSAAGRIWNTSSTAAVPTGLRALEPLNTTSLIESPRRIEVSWATSLEGKLALARILEASERPTGVFAHNDQLALGLIEAMRESGMRCPDDLAIVGFNNTEASKVLAVPLTTVDYPVAEVGRRAGELVEALILDRAAKCDSKTFRPALVKRAST